MWKRILLIILLCPSLSIHAQSVSDIQQDPSYLWGTGNGATLKQADDNALAALVSQISTTVSSRFEQLIDEKKENDQIATQEQVSSIIRTYSGATLNNTRRIVIQNEPDAVVMRYIKADEVARIFEGRKTKLLDFVDEAVKLEQKAQVADALRYYYWAYILLQSYPDGSLLTRPDDQGEEQLLTTWIPQQMNHIFEGISLKVESVKLADNLQTIALSVTYRGKPARNYDYSYFDGRDWSNLYSAKDGRGIIELPAAARLDKLSVKTEYMFEGQAPALKQNSPYPSNYTYKYPKAGEKNSKVSVYVYDIEDRTTLKMDTGKEEDIYLPRIRWTKDPKQLAIIRLNRHQNKMEVLLANVKVGTTTPLYREENKYYIAESNLDNLVFLDNGKEFVITSEKSGYMHLYLYDMAGREKQAITKGDYDIIDFYGYDPVRKLFYYSSYEESPLEKYVYSINLKGMKKKLTPVEGWNEAAFSKTFNYYINVVSNKDMPPVTTLYNAKGKEVRVLADNKQVAEKVKEYKIAKREFIQVPAADGTTMLNAWIMKPVDMEAGKKYPLLITQYSGPNSQEVTNSWSLDWLNYLAQEGFVVACVDPRGTAARGEEFRKCTYMQLGKIESDDMIAAAKWLAGQDYVDSRHVGIWGWSFGGFMSSLCLMKGCDVFTTAIAVAPVTNWRYYDSIYTERYMRTPAENAAGYDTNAPMHYVDQLKGNLLLCHGTADDNVHVQNTYELAERLVQANKQFDMAIYTNRNHGIYGGNTTLQLYTRFVNYLMEHMK